MAAASLLVGHAGAGAAAGCDAAVVVVVSVARLKAVFDGGRGFGRDWAIAAGYLGLVSILLIFAPFALGTGIYALHDIREHPGRLAVGRAWFGIVMGTIFTALFLFTLVG